jgi:hypothetical protein
VVSRCRAVASGGPPYSRLCTARSPKRSGAHALGVNGTSQKALLWVVEPGERRPRRVPRNGIWTTRRSWNDDWERVFSAWVAHLFRPLPGKTIKGWRRLHTVVENPRRNFLYNRLGYLEDDLANPNHIRAAADCGDTPYFLRAYFAWKMGLPFRYRRCSRGDGRTGPRCRDSVSNETDRLDSIEHPVARFVAFFERLIKPEVHSGTMRTLPNDEKSDFYPVALSRNAIRPGTVFVDSGGHALMVTQWDESGLFAIDGHPDKTVTRRRFSPRFFRYFAGLTTGGFKAFRPVKVKGDGIAPLSNLALKRFFSLEQYAFETKQAFYHRMQSLIGE